MQSYKKTLTILAAVLIAACQKPLFPGGPRYLREPGGTAHGTRDSVKRPEEAPGKKLYITALSGNNAVLLSTGKAAALCGRFLQDDALLQIGAEQLYWTVGKNPFGQSLIYGEGHRYPQMSSFSSGELTGEMPVGIRSLDDTDEPFWPAVNNACYKEVWVTSSGKWLSLLSELSSREDPHNP